MPAARVMAAAAAGVALIVLTFPVDAAAQARLPHGPIPVDCNRACLEGLVNQYLDAVVAHDPSRLPLSADVRIENNLIRRVEMIGTSVPYHFNSAWSSISGQ